MGAPKRVWECNAKSDLDYARLNIIILACLIDEHRLISQTHAPCLVLSRAAHDALPSLGLRKGLVMLRATQGPSSLLSLIHAALPGMLSLLALSLLFQSALLPSLPTL